MRERRELLLYMATYHSLAHVEHLPSSQGQFLCVFCFQRFLRVIEFLWAFDFWQTLCFLVWKSKHDHIGCQGNEIPAYSISNLAEALRNFLACIIDSVTEGWKKNLDFDIFCLMVSCLVSRCSSIGTLQISSTSWSTLGCWQSEYDHSQVDCWISW